MSVRPCRGRLRPLVVLAALLALAPAGSARAEIALVLPPPDTAALVPLASPPLDKPPVPLPAVLFATVT